MMQIGRQTIQMIGRVLRRFARPRIIVSKIYNVLTTIRRCCTNDDSFVTLMPPPPLVGTAPQFVTSTGNCPISSLMMTRNMLARTRTKTLLTILGHRVLAVRSLVITWVVNWLSVLGFLTIPCNLLKLESTPLCPELFLMMVCSLCLVCATLSFDRTTLVIVLWLRPRPMSDI